MAGAGLVVLAETEAELVAAVERALADPQAFAVAPQDEADRVARTVAHYGAIFDAVIAAGRRRRPLTTAHQSSSTPPRRPRPAMIRSSR